MWVAWPMAVVLVVIIASLEARRRQTASESATPTVQLQNLSELAAKGYRLPNGVMPTVKSALYVDLGVKESIEAVEDTVTFEGTRSHLGSTLLERSEEIVPYVKRDVDDELRVAVQRGGFVLVFGPSAAGKSRTAFQSLAELPADTPLFIPEIPEGLSYLAENRDALEDSVLWLDDLDRFIVPGGLNAAIVDRLLGANGQGMLILATIRGEALSAFEGADTLSTDREARSLIRIGIDVLSQVNHRIEVRSTLSAEETRSAQALSSEDTRIRQALRHREFGFGEYLAAGPQMLNRWTAAGDSAINPGSAIISAAVDCRRAGFNKPIPREVLRSLYREYLEPNVRDYEEAKNFEKHLQWALSRVARASSCLLPKGDGLYLATDYLLDRTLAGVGPLSDLPISEAVWSPLIALSDTATLFPIGASAYLSGCSDVAIQAFQSGAQKNEKYCMNGLGIVLLQQGDNIQGVEWLKQAEAAGLTEATMNLAFYEWNDGSQESALRRYEDLATNKQYSPAMMALAVIARKSNEESVEEHWFRLAAESGYPPAMHALAQILVDQGENDEAKRWYLRAGAAGHLGSVTSLAKNYEDQGDIVNAIQTYRQAISSGDMYAISLLGQLLERQRHFDDAEEVYRRGALAGYLPSMLDLALLLSDQGLMEQAELWWRRAAEEGAPAAMNALGNILGNRGDIKEAEAWFIKASQNGYHEALINRDKLLRSHKADSDVEPWYKPYFGITEEQ